MSRKWINFFIYRWLFLTLDSGEEISEKSLIDISFLKELCWYSPQVKFFPQVLNDKNIIILLRRSRFDEQKTFLLQPFDCYAFSIGNLSFSRNSIKELFHLFSQKNWCRCSQKPTESFLRLSKERMRKDF